MPITQLETINYFEELAGKFRSAEKNTVPEINLKPEPEAPQIIVLLARLDGQPWLQPIRFRDLSLTLEITGELSGWPQNFDLLTIKVHYYTSP